VDAPAGPDEAGAELKKKKRDFRRNAIEHGRAPVPRE